MPLSLDFAFEGFRIIREKPKLILFWGLVLLIGSGVAELVVVAMGGPSLERLSAMAPTADPTLLLPLYMKVIQAYGVALPLIVVTQAVTACAAYRATWQAKDDRFGYLRFGADEWRQIAVTLLFFLLYLIMAFAAAAVSGTIGMAIGDKTGVVATPLMLLGFGAIVVAMLRLSLCNVLSFDQKRINLFGSWKLTQGQGWTLLGGYLVCAVMVAFVVLLCGGIFGAVTVALYGGDWSTVNQWFLQPDMTSLTAYLKPLMIGWLVISNLAVSPLLVALTSGGQAAAYRTLAGQIPDPGI
jgi:hypothetical protein